MFFHLHNAPPSHSRAGLRVIENDEPILLAPNVLYLMPGRQKLFTWDVPAGQLVLMGDPIFPASGIQPARLVPEDGRMDETTLYEEVRGHYYWFLFHKKGMNIGTSFGAVFPVYYHCGASDCQISSSSFFLAAQSGLTKLDRCNLLERLLFNYPLFQSTWWEEIKLLPSHRHLEVTGSQARVEGDFDISRFFRPLINKNRQHLDYLAALFEEEANLFFPDEPFGISLTGGFDGRSLLAAALKRERDFVVFCFGRSESADLAISQALATKLNLPFYPIKLEGDYVDQEALRSAHNFMQLTEFNGNLGRPHYEYAARMLSTKTRYIITGNFGSELFRALHAPGAMLSRSLIHVFQDNRASWKDALKEAAEAWGKRYFDQELAAIIAKLETYLESLHGLEENERFYHFVFNELLRKYFGPELVMQNHYMNNRTPYLSFKFIRALNQTQWAGVHSRLFEKNLAKRMKGQKFHAALLRQTNRLLYLAPTSKGYCPADVLEIRRLPCLAALAIYKKHFSPAEVDPHSVLAFFRANHHRLAAQLIQSTSSPIIEPLIQQSKKPISAGEDLHHWIKFYSIAMGWEAARKNEVPRLISQMTKLHHEGYH
jgi:asparagine synthase (glutamine-hydrolysing)